MRVIRSYDYANVEYVGRFSRYRLYISLIWAN